MKKPFLYILLSLSVVLVFFPCFTFGFNLFDDQQHLLSNPAILISLPDSLLLIFTQFVNNTWIPLTTLTFALEHHFFGFNPFVYHSNNIILHLANTFLLYFLATRMGLSVCASFFAALIFAIHPMRVESIAWVTERKDVLYAFFYLCALHQYWSYLENKKQIHYLACLLLGILSILAKPMALSLVLVLLLLDWYKGRFGDKNILLEKVPFFVYTILIGWVTYYLNIRNPVNDLLEAFCVWIWCLSFYIWKFFLPLNVYTFYKLPVVHWWSIPYLASFVGLSIVIFLIVRLKNRLLTFSFLFYFVSIFFLLRFSEGVDASIVSDRFMYLPCLGFCFLLGVWAEQLIKSRWLMFTLLSVLLVMGVKTNRQCLIWKDTLAYSNDQIKNYPNMAPTAYLLRGVAYSDKKDYVSAEKDFTRAIECQPDYVQAFFNRAIVNKELGNNEMALKDINRAIAIDPDYAQSYLVRSRFEYEAGDLVSAKNDAMIYRNKNEIILRGK